MDKVYGGIDNNFSFLIEVFFMKSNLISDNIGSRNDAKVNSLFTPNETTSF